MTNALEYLMTLFQCHPWELAQYLAVEGQRSFAEEHLRSYCKCLVTTYHSPPKHITFHRLTEKSAATQNAYRDRTVQQHYGKIHDIHLKWPILQCIVHRFINGYEIFYPIELVDIVEHGTEHIPRRRYDYTLEDWP